MIGFTLVVIAGSLALALEAQAFDCNVTRFDEVSAQATFFGSRTSEAQTEQALKTRCQMFDQDVSYLQEYTKNCVQGLANGMVKLLLEGATNDMTGRCTDPSIQENYLKLIPCINRHGSEFLKCNKNVAAVLEGANLKPKKSRVPLSCCYMGTFAECITKTARKCGVDHENLAKQIINNYAEDLLSTVCVKWKAGSKACKDLPRIAPIPNPKYKSIIAPLADVLHSLNN